MSRDYGKLTRFVSDTLNFGSINPKVVDFGYKSGKMKLDYGTYGVWTATPSEDGSKHILTCLVPTRKVARFKEKLDCAQIFSKCSDLDQ